MELIDTHAHLTFPELEDQVDAVLQRSIEAGVTSWITVGTDTGQVEKALALAARHQNMYTAIGFHPHHANEISPQDIEFLKRSWRNNKVVAIGETGLDYHYDNVVAQRQKDIFRSQLEIAAAAGLPVIVHTREAFDDTIAVLDEFASELKRIVVHCFGGTMQQAGLILDRGYYISLTGVATFKRSDQLREVAATIPLQRLMIETDCPYISPEPVRNQRPCEPAMLVHTARLLAGLHNMSLEDFAVIVTRTSRRFFGLP